MPGERLLIVDDEENLRSMLAAALRHHGFDVSAVGNGRDALTAVSEMAPDLVVLDVMLPDLDGFEVCRRPRAPAATTRRVLFLTARDATEDLVRGLTLGGDDYVQKPFSLEELVARASAVLRRTGRARDERTVLTCADLVMDDDAHQVTRAGVDVSLSPTEYNLLRYLLINQGRVLSKAQILDHVWQYDFGGDGGVVETYIGYLRRKLDNQEPRLITTVRGVGYALRTPVRSASAAMGGLSLRARVVAGMALVVVALVVAAVLIAATTRDYLIDQVDDRLAAAADFRPDDDLGGMRPQGPGDGPQRPSDVYEGRIGDDGELVSLFEPNLRDEGAPDIDADRAAAAAATGEPVTIGAAGSDVRYRAVVRRGGEGSLYVTAVPLTDVDDTMSRLITVEVIATLVIATVLAAVTWWVIRLGIRPIKQMTHTATEIAGGDMSQRVPEMAPSTEAGELGGALNHMLTSLEQAFAERAESQDRLRRFVADASHELRTPVATIRGYAELYRIGGLDEPAELGEAMRRTEQEAIRMARLVDDLLTLAKFDEARPLDRRPVDLSALAADAARDAGAVDPDRPISTTLTGPVVVSGDEDRLRQVIANIVGNALVHTPRDVAVEIGVAITDGEARLSVTDQGPGMTADVAAQVTERFYRADPARARVRGGSGLGMAIADSAVASHGGAIHVDSAVGRGTSVTVTLPLG